MSVSEVFTELFFGEGAYLGLILVLMLVFVCGRVNKYLNLLFIAVLGLFTIQYFSNITVNSNFTWCGIISIFGCVLLLIQYVKFK